MDDTIIARADALMQRRRHSAPDAEDLPVLTEVAPPATPAPGEDDDIPTLTMAVAAPPAPARPALEAGPASAPVDIQALAAQLAVRIEQRIVAELPRLIDEAVAQALAEHKSAFSPTPPTRPSS